MHDAQGDFLDAANEAAVEAVDFIFSFFAGEDQAFNISDDDEIAIVSAWGPVSFVLAHEDRGDLHSEMTEDDAFRAGMVPVADDSFIVNKRGLHNIGFRAQGLKWEGYKKWEG